VAFADLLPAAGVVELGNELRVVNLNVAGGKETGVLREPGKFQGMPGHIQPHKRVRA